MKIYFPQIGIIFSFRYIRKRNGKVLSISRWKVREKISSSSRFPRETGFPSSSAALHCTALHCTAVGSTTPEKCWGREFVGSSVGQKAWIWRFQSVKSCHMLTSFLRNRLLQSLSIFIVVFISLEKANLHLKVVLHSILVFSFSYFLFLRNIKGKHCSKEL